MFFSEVIGQEEIKQRLIHQVNEQRISHLSYLPALKGPENLLWHWLLHSLFRAATGRIMTLAANAPRAGNIVNLHTLIYILCFLYLQPKNFKNLLVTILFHNGAKW